MTATPVGGAAELKPHAGPCCKPPGFSGPGLCLIEHPTGAPWEPPAGKVGFLYMLSGGTDASNTDPHATGPAPGNNWVETGPHVMVVGAKGMMEGYPREPLPATEAPYVMWAGTPYEHLVLPVR
jgi:hypothetical protein